MRKISLLLMFVASTVLARDEYQRSFDKTLSVQPGENVLIEHKFGDIVVRTHPGQDVIIHADIRVSAPTAAAAKEFAARVEILVEPSSELSIRTRYPAESNSFFGSRNVSYSAHYEVTLPETCPLSIRNAFGAVSVTGLKANADITNSHGDLVIRDGRGSQRLQNAFARVEVSKIQGNITIDTSNGPVEASDITGSLTVRDRFANLDVSRVSSSVTIVNNNGAIELTDAGGASEIRNSFGNVVVRNCRGNLIVHNGNGRIDAANVTGAADLKTSFAEVHFTNITGSLSVRANNSKVSGNKVGGSATVANSFSPVEISDIARDAHVESGNGAVSLERVGGAANVSTSFGPVVLNDVVGAIDVRNQNGSAEVSSAVRSACEPISMRTSFSNMIVRLRPDASYRVSAHTSFGNIKTDFPISASGSLSNDVLSGVIGAGRCELTLVNSNGSIEILKR